MMADKRNKRKQGTKKRQENQVMIKGKGDANLSPDAGKPLI
jgi:hypothetical protein